MRSDTETTFSSTRFHGPRGRRIRWSGGAMAATLLLVSAVTTGCGQIGSVDQQDMSVGDTPGPVTYQYKGVVQKYQVPPGVTSISIIASGGAGGNSHTAYYNNNGGGAQVTGTVAVQTGQWLLISVGQVGGSAGSHDSDPKGGWGGLTASGGNGNAASDTLRTGAAGGGASTIQLTDVDGNNPQTILVAGGGGGAGGPSGDPYSVGAGGAAGCTDPEDTMTPSWTGSNGGNGDLIHGGKGGTAAGQPGMSGARSKGGSGLGGNGGGGGGGVNGGNGGGSSSGTSAAAGGGAGSSAVTGMTDTSVTCRVADDGYGMGNGQITITPVAV